MNLLSLIELAVKMELVGGRGVDETRLVLVIVIVIVPVSIAAMAAIDVDNDDGHSRKEDES